MKIYTFSAYFGKLVKTGADQKMYDSILRITYIPLMVS